MLGGVGSAGEIPALTRLCAAFPAMRMASSMDDRQDNDVGLFYYEVNAKRKSVHHSSARASVDDWKV
jgi:hypothetical protein